MGNKFLDGTALAIVIIGAINWALIGLLRFDLVEEFSIETALVVCEIYRYNGDWKFNAVAAGYQGGLEALCRAYGVNV